MSKQIEGLSFRNINIFNKKIGPFKFPDYTTIGELKVFLRAKLNRSADIIPLKIFYNNIELDNNMTLNSYGIPSESEFMYDFGDIQDGGKKNKTIKRRKNTKKLKRRKNTKRRNTKFKKYKI